MTEYAQYFLPATALLLVGLWVWARHTSPSIRARQWLAISTLTAIPAIAISQLWWPWTITSLSLFNFHQPAIVLIISLFLGLITITVRRLLNPAFNQPLQLSWTRYGASLIVFIVTAQFSEQLPWPRDVSIVMILSAILLYNLVTYFTVARLYQYLLTTVLALASLIIFNSVADIFAPSTSDWSMSFIHLWLDEWTLATYILLVVSWPIIVSWWTNQRSEAV